MENLKKQQLDIIKKVRLMPKFYKNKTVCQKLGVGILK